MPEVVVEEVIVVVLQFLVEVVLEVFLSWVFDSSTYVPNWPSVGQWFRYDKVTGKRTGFGWYVLYLGIGGILGGLSLLIAPRFVLPFVGLRIANLIAAPIAAGTLSWWAAQGRQNRSDHFWMSFCFALAFSAVRLMGAN